MSIDREGFEYVSTLIRTDAGLVLEAGKEYLVEARLRPLAQEAGLTSVQDFIQQLRMPTAGRMRRRVIEAMTTNETSFFRDLHPYESLKKVILPRVIENRRNERRINIWSAACSTGQEAYSTGMLLLEHFPQLANWNVKIEGTDISSEVVHRCQAGAYHRIEMNRGLPARNIVRFFDHHGEDWTVKPELKKLCNFRIANLCGNQLPFTEKFDLIFLRNVMLYFSQDTRRILMAGIHRLLAPDGVLFLGSAEQPADPTIWNAILAGGTCYFRPKAAR